MNQFKYKGHEKKRTTTTKKYPPTKIVDQRSKHLLASKRNFSMQICSILFMVIAAYKNNHTHRTLWMVTVRASLLKSTSLWFGIFICLTPSFRCNLNCRRRKKRLPKNVIENKKKKLWRNHTHSTSVLRCDYIRFDQLVGVVRTLWSASILILCDSRMQIAVRTHSYFMQ